jgi:hypothetical protein
VNPNSWHVALENQTVVPLASKNPSSARFYSSTKQR